MVSPETLLLVAAVLLLLSVIASKTSGRLGVPALLLFLTLPTWRRCSSERSSPPRKPRVEKTMVAWVGLRGAVPIVLATLPVLAGVPGAERLFNLVFFVVLTSVLLQGTSIPAVARWLGVDVAAAPPPAPFEISAVASASASARLREMRVPAGWPTAGRRVLDLGLPPGALVVLLKRGDHVIIPDGGTAIEAGDVVVVLADERAHATIQSLVEGGAPPPTLPGRETTACGRVPARRARTLCRLLDDLPVRVLPQDLPGSKLPVVASAHSNSAPLRRRARQKPLGDAHIATDPVSIITVVDVREAFEARCQPLAHGHFACEALSPGLRPAGHVQ